VTPAAIAALVVALAFFCVLHAWIALGPRLAIASLAATVAISWTLEELGATTGLLYGGYHYTPALGPQVGSVPVLIPLAWFALAYPTSVLVGMVAGRWGPDASGGRSGIVASALVGALLMTAWDLALDPILSGPAYGAWVWEATGPTGAVPAQNYLGWFVTAFAILLAWRLLGRSAAGVPRGSLAPA
jgi:uncharacterized membrane protein